MKIPIRILQAFLAPALLFFASGCGGGGSNPEPTLSLNTTSVTFNGDFSDPIAPAGQSIVGSIANAKSTIYLGFQESGSLLSDITLEVLGASQGRINLFPRPASQAGMGSHTSTLTVIASTDQAGLHPIAGSPQYVQITYNVTGFSVNAGSLAFNAVEGSAAAPRNLQVTNTTPTSAWTSTVMYDPGATGWLTLSPGAGSGSGSLTVTPSTLPPGTYTATIRLESGVHVYPIPVTYTVGTNVSLAPSLVAFTAVSGQTQMPAAAQLAVSSVSGSTTYTTSIQYGDGASGWLTAMGSAIPGTFTLAPNTTSLTPNVPYTATVTLNPANGLTPVQATVTYTLTTSTLMVGNAAPFTINGSSTVDALSQKVSTSDSGARLMWTAASDSSWLSVTPSGASGDQATLAVVPSALATKPSGTLNANVTFTYSGPGDAAGTRVINVPLTLNLPTVTVVTPHVVYSGSQDEMVIRGNGFLQAAAPQVTFGGQTPTSIEVKSDTELRVVPPAGLTPGTVKVATSANILGLDRSGSFVVRNAPSYPAASIPCTSDFIGRLLYDAERDAIFYSSAGYVGSGKIYRTAYNASTSTWTTTSVFEPGLFDIALTPDGKHLMALLDRQILYLDPVTLATVDFADSNLLSGSGTGHQFVVANDGLALMPGMGVSYSTVTRTFSRMQNLNSTIGFADISGDGSLAVMGYYDTDPINYFEAATDTVKKADVTGYVFPCSLDRKATKVLMGNTIRTPTMVKVGQLSAPAPYNQQGACLSPDGTRAYIIDQQASSVRVFDVSGNGPGYPELAQLPVTTNGYGPILLTPNGKYLFVWGNTYNIVIHPLP